MTTARRVYEMRFFTGAILALPLVVLTSWYAWSAFASIDRYRRAADPKLKITLELFHLALHDELARDLRRLFLRSRPEPSALPTYELSLSRDKLDELNQNDGPAQEGEANYVRALVKKDGEVHEARVRYRGGQPWHFLGAQKSMKIRIDRGELLDGVRAFNLINDPTPFGLEDQLILELARESGLLTPEYRPVWVRINNSDFGVYRYEAQPDEGLIRRSNRMPGSMYSGDTDAIDPKTKSGAVFSDKNAWRKVSSRSEETKSDMRELERMLAAIHGTHEQFAAFIAAELDLDRYAMFDALDVVFGGSEHDWSSNHKFYVDPYTGRLEPVAWSFRGFQHEPTMNFIDHPLLIRLKMTPGYLARRDRAVYDLLTERASVPAIRARVESAIATLAPELVADPWWDAYKLLPRVSRSIRFMPRPMSLERWALAGEAELDGFAVRSRFLLNILEEPGIDVRASRIDASLARIDLVLSGAAAYALRDTSFVSETCADPQASLWADVDLDGSLDVPASALTHLYSGIVLEKRENTRPKSGSVRAVAEPRLYTYFVRSNNCALDDGVFELENLITGGTTRLKLVFAAPDSPPATRIVLPRASDRVAFQPGERSPHVWDFPPPPAPEVILLGPGAVRFDQTKKFRAHETVRIAPKTVIALGPEASLIFEGRVHAEGPLSIVRAETNAPWGGIALQGKHTAGSRLNGVVLRGGSFVRDDVISYSALINIHDTSDIAIERLSADAPAAAEDVLHANSVRDLVLHELDVRDAPIDGIDLELTSAELSGVRVIGAGDDCLDLGGAETRVRDSVFVACANNAVSAGEESEVSLHGSLIAGAKVGVLAKNGGDVRATRSVIWETGVALKTNFKEVYYTKKSAIGASELYAPRTEAVRDAAKDTTIEAGSVLQTLPDQNALRHLRVHVLHLDDWSELESAVARMREGTR